MMLFTKETKKKNLNHICDVIGPFYRGRRAAQSFIIAVGKAKAKVSSVGPFRDRRNTIDIDTTLWGPCPNCHHPIAQM